MLNKIFFKLPFVTSPAKEQAKTEETVNTGTENIQNADTEDEDIDLSEKYGFNKKSSSKYTNALIGSLMGLSVLTVPTLEIIDSAGYKHNNYSVNIEPKEEVICNPEKLAQGCGDDDSMVELEEMMNLIDFSGMSQLPKSTQEAIHTVVSAHIQPINVNDPDAREKIIKQTQEIQKMVDKLIYNEVVNPSKSPEEKIAEFRRNNITADDVLEFVDFSELQKYQKDISVLRANLRTSIGSIPRKDYDSNERAEKAAQNAQKLVDKITAKYKRYAKIVGNNDYDHTLSKEELIGLLDLRSADGIAPKRKAKIIANATAGYKTVNFKDVQDGQIKEMNQKVCEEVQKVQDKLDREANGYRKKQFEAQYGIYK